MTQLWKDKNDIEFVRQAIPPPLHM